MIYVFNEQEIDINAPQVIGDVQYPPHWFEDAAARAAIGMECGVTVASPAFDQATQRIDELPPALIDGVWTQQWAVVQLTPDEISARIALTELQRQAIYADMGAYLAEVRDIREKILNRLAGIGFAALASGDAATSTAVLAARTALLDITKAPAVLAATDRDTLKAAFIATYQGIVASCPENLHNAFLLVDA